VLELVFCIHAVKKATRFEALEPVRQGVREHFGFFSQGGATGLRLRHDHGSVYMSDDFQNEIWFLGIESSPAFVRQPEGNACIERFFRTLKEQLLWIHHFHDLDELQTALAEFRDRYSNSWIIGRPAIAHRPRQGVTSRLLCLLRHDSMNQLTPSLLSNPPRPKQH
jgi:putative transposase